MMSMNACFRSLSIMAVVLDISLIFSAKLVYAADMPAPPKVSTFAPAEDLANQVDAYIDEMKDTLATAQNYQDDDHKIGRLANTLVVISLCAGLSDEACKYKPQAAALIKTAKALAATKKYDEAKKAFEDVLAAQESKVQDQSQLKWEKTASLSDLMKQVPNINTKLKRNITDKKFKPKAKETAGYTAAIAAIAQGAMPDAGKAKNPQEEAKWYEYSANMRDAAGETNAAIHKKDKAAADKAMEKLAQSCDDCHVIFNPPKPGQKKASERE